MARPPQELPLEVMRRRRRAPACCVHWGVLLTEQDRWQIHHRQWRGQGGDESLDNLELLHEICHRQKHSCRMGTK